MISNTSEKSRPAPSATPAATPAVSVVMTCYNHETFITQAVESILSQSFRDLELIVVDDGSSDGTRKILNGFQDPRLHVVLQDNHGPSHATNVGLARARGGYVALMSGDDVSYVDRLALQHAYCEATGVDFAFCLPRLIDGSGNVLDDSVHNVFFGKQAQRPADFYKLLFEHGNFLCAPSAFIRRSALSDIGGMHEALIQLQDFDLWVRASARYRLGLMGERLVQYRLLSNYGNLSNRKNAARAHFELAIVMKSFLDHAPVKLLRECFPMQIGAAADDGSPALEIDKSFIYLSHPLSMVRAVGAERLTHMLNHAPQAARLASEYNFSPRDLFRITEQIDLQNLNELWRLQASCSARLETRRAA